MQYAFNIDFHMIYDDFPKEPIDFLLLLELITGQTRTFGKISSWKKR